MTPSIGRTVHYCLSEADADQINRRRTDGRTIARRLVNLHWHEGAQAHIGNPARAGQVFPMVIVVVNEASPGKDGDETQPGFPAMPETVNGQVFLDGTDVLWTKHVGQVAADSADKAGCWFEPPRVSLAGNPAGKPDAPKGDAPPAPETKPAE